MPRGGRCSRAVQASPVYRRVPIPAGSRGDYSSRSGTDAVAGDPRQRGGPPAALLSRRQLTEIHQRALWHGLYRRVGVRSAPVAASVVMLSGAREPPLFVALSDTIFSLFVNTFYGRTLGDCAVLVQCIHVTSKAQWEVRILPAQTSSHWCQTWRRGLYM